MVMRISTQIIQNSGTQGILRGQSDLVRLQQQLSTGKKMLTAADDPIAAARAVSIESARARNAQFKENVDAAKPQAAFAETTLAAVADTMQEVRDLAVRAGNGALNEADRTGLVVALRGAYDRLLGLANTRDGSGNFVFGGYRDQSPPFQDTPTGAVYMGDQGERILQVTSSRAVSVGPNGSDVFERVRTANGVFTTAAANANAGTALIDRGTVADPTALTGESYAIRFTVAGNVTTYDVVNTTTNTTLSAGNAFVEGQPISVGGMQFAITGAPVNGDEFTAGPSRNQSIFKTMTDLMSALTRPGSGPVAAARFANEASTALANIDQGLETVVSERAALGATMKELDTIAFENSDFDLKYQAELSDLVDVDYAKAITEFTARQQALEAAQASFMRVTRLSLFDQL